MLTLQKREFSLPADSIYLNCAYMSPLLKSVEKAGIEGIKRKRNPYAISAEDFFTDTEKLRKEFSRVINLDNPKRVAVIPSVSYGLANVSNNLAFNNTDNIVVAQDQFPSNFYPWLRQNQEKNVQIKIVAPPDVSVDRGRIWNERIWNAIDKNTRLVALGNVHWADGTKFNLIEIRKRTRDVGALLVIDGTQSVGALPFSVKDIQPDALICAGYKWLFGPYSIGLVYYGDYFDNGRPIEDNWINRKDSEDFKALVNYQNDYQPGAMRYDVGERSNFILTPMMITALKQINRWRPGNIQQYCAKISYEPVQMLREAGFWIEDEKFRGRHLFGVRVPKDKNIEKIKKRLQKFKISVSLRGDAIRVSPHVYNSENDLFKLAEALIG